MEIDFKNGMNHFAAVFEKQREEPPSYDLAIERLAAVKADVDEAEDKGVFVPLPESEPKISKDRSRIKTIRNRLFILGYLKKDTGRGNLDTTLKEAILKFQKEADLKQDGWVGEKETWPALQELVSFETPINLSWWFDSGIPKPALRRAVALRLFALGLKEEKPISPNEDIERGLRSFGSIWRILSLGETQTEPGPNLEWLGLLFDMDRITGRLSEVGAELSEEDLLKVHSLILNAAKIELWLIGYSVQPGGYDLKKSEPPQTGSEELTGLDVWMRSKTITRFHKVKKNMRFHKALHKFWIDHGKDDDTADGLSVNFLQNFQMFFKMVDEGLQADRELSVAHRLEDLEAFIEGRKEQIPQIWKKVSEIGARLWDGVRRVWGWFKRMITVFKKKVLEIGTNLSRIIYDFALGSFTVVSNVFKSIGTTIELIVKPRMPGSDKRHVVFHRDLDSDPRVVVHGSADGREVANCCKTLQRKTRLFAFGCRVLGTFISLLVEVFRTAWTAYFGLVLALIKLQRMSYKFKSLDEEYRVLFLTTA